MMGSEKPPANLSSLLRLKPLELSDLPAHPSIPSSSSATKDPRPTLSAFLTSLLDEASTLVSPPGFSSTFSQQSSKPSPPSTTPVALFRGKKDDESWVARRSVHEDESGAVREGSASWDEFVYGIKREHSRREMDYTPDVFDARYLLDWAGEIKSVLTRGDAEEGRVEEEKGWIEGGQGRRYTDVTMETLPLLKVYEMCHSLPGPLSPRCFPILVITASTSADSFIVATVTVNLGSPSPSTSTPALPAAYYSTGRNVTHPDAGASRLQRKKTVSGRYVAVESVRVLSSEEVEEGSRANGDGNERGKGKEKGQIEWTMALASDARGWLPMPIQIKALPGAISGDVGLFIKWIAKEKDKGK